MLTNTPAASAKRAQGARVVVAEDEAIVRKDIEDILTAQGHTVVGRTARGEEVLELCLEHRPDVVLMDILLQGTTTGIDAAHGLRELIDLPVIFLTANTDDATLSKARVAMPYGYVAKPFKPVDLLATIEVAVHNHTQDLRARLERDQLLGMLAGDNDNAMLFVKNNGRMVGVRTQDIHYVEALKDYVGIHVEGKRYVVHSTMNDIERRLPAGRFMRVHRSFIVRLDRIKAIEHADLVLEKNDQVIPIGNMYLGRVRERLALV